MESTAACLSPRSGVTAPIADPSVGLKRRNVRDRMLIRFYRIEIKFLRVLFFKHSLHQFSKAKDAFMGIDPIDLKT
jgi:hypothetical protein